MSEQIRPVFAPDIEAELSDERFINRQHGIRATHSAGCHGPMCRLAETLRGRRRNELNALHAGREYKPNYRVKRDDSRVKEIEAAIEWNQADLARRREEADSARETKYRELLEARSVMLGLTEAAS